MMTLIKTSNNLQKTLIKKTFCKDSKIKFIKRQSKLLKKPKKMDMKVLMKNSKHMKISLKKLSRKINFKTGKNTLAYNVRFKLMVQMIGKNI